MARKEAAATTGENFPVKAKDEEERRAILEVPALLKAIAKAETETGESSKAQMQIINERLAELANLIRNNSQVTEKLARNNEMLAKNLRDRQEQALTQVKGIAARIERGFRWLVALVLFLGFSAIMLYHFDSVYSTGELSKRLTTLQEEVARTNFRKDLLETGSQMNLEIRRLNNNLTKGELKNNQENTALVLKELNSINENLKLLKKTEEKK